MDNIKSVMDDKITLSFAISGFVLAVFAFFLLVKHDMGTFFRLRRDSAQIRENIAVLTSITGYKDYIREFDSEFVTSNDANWLMEILTTLAAQEDVSIGMIRPLASRIVSTYNMLGVEAAGEASYSGLLHLLSDIENYKTYIYVEYLALGSHEQSSAATARSIRYADESQQRSVNKTGTGTIRFTLRLASPAR